MGARNAAWATGLLLTALVLLALSPLPVAGEVETRLSSALAPVAGAIRSAVRPASDLLLNTGQISQLSTENADLRRRLAQTEAELATMREERTALDQAAALLSAVGPHASQFTAASVLVRDPAPGRQNVVIDRGRDHGVRAGQPVLGAGGTLVGIVADVDARQSRIRLLTDRDSAIAVLIQSSRTPAALAGDGRALSLEFVPIEAAIATGEVVLTSALGGLLPPGLLVGRVSAVESRGSDLFQRVSVDPLANLDRVEQVLVMTGFQPGALLPGEATTP
ncbi:MAG: rod shape-determining protein MreC [Chloroflexi bacterium]|nr:rod shape-determining protein MreC [Chloroflexota bacterium]